MAEQESGSTPESSIPTGVFAAEVNNVADTHALIARGMAAAEPNGVFGAPIEKGAFTVITCSEVGGGLGAGFGGGTDASGSGSGGGGGGGSFGRPVAVIVVGPNGVDVEPVFDMTKVGIAALAAVGALFLSWGRMSRP